MIKVVNGLAERSFKMAILTFDVDNDKFSINSKVANFFIPIKHKSGIKRYWEHIRRMKSFLNEVHAELMLNITGLNRFFFVRDFHNMRCKYDKVLSIIHQQLNCESEDGDVFIVMSKDLRLVRLFSYDQRSYSMFEKRFRLGYKFMQVT